ncbi:hypothetical protein ARMGADRAFT_1019540 [Armillaria gallica]|uniref:Uncharacterized protein n=1 Tax=Armillaria gallica TaxID=47427 RepID=A0A2H3CW44_ARMGA|nr:hypothetical protein ARMGADRAFT_1019540 [Armillaria gallica]
MATHIRKAHLNPSAGIPGCDIHHTTPAPCLQERDTFLGPNSTCYFDAEVRC